MLSQLKNLHPHGYRTAAMGLAAMLGVSLPALGQTPEELATEKTQTPAVQTSPEVVVSATRIDTPISQVGSSITVIDGQVIEQRQERQMSDVLRHVPGVHVRRNSGPGSTTSIFIRGAESDHTLFLLDGIKFHDTAAPGGLPAIDHLTVNNLDRVEVLRGPQSTLYGTEAIGGVVSATTKRGEGPLHGSFSVEGGSYYTAIERLTLGMGEDRFNLSINATRIDSGGFSTHRGDFEKDPYRNSSLHSRFGIALSDNVEIDTVFHAIHAEVEFDDTFSAGVTDNTWQTEYRQYAFKVEPKVFLFDGRVESRLALTMNQINRRNEGANGWFAFLPNEFNSRVWELDWQNTIQIGEDNTLVLGLNYEHKDAEFIPLAGASVKANTNMVGFYLEDQWQPIEALTLTGGMRVIHHDDFGTKTTYRFTGAYKLEQTQTIVRASVGTGFKAPSLADMFDTTSFVNNPNLQPEESLGYDLGIEQSLFDQRVTLGATYFHNKIKDMIFFDGTTFVVTNLGDVRINGLESFVRVQPIKQFVVSAHYTYTDTKVINAQGTFGPQPGARVLRRPLHSFGFDMTCLFWNDRAQVTLGVLADSERDDTGGAKSKGYAIVNLSGSVQMTDRVELFARVENLLNEQYQDNASFNTADASAYAGVKVTF